MSLLHICLEPLFHWQSSSNANWKAGCGRLIGEGYKDLTDAWDVIVLYSWWFVKILWWASQVASVVKNPPANAGDLRDAVSIPGLGRSPGGGHGNPVQYSCLENPCSPGGLQSITSQRVRCNSSDLTHTHTHARSSYVQLVSQDLLPSHAHLKQGWGWSLNSNLPGSPKVLWRVKAAFIWKKS